MHDLVPAVVQEVSYVNGMVAALVISIKRFGVNDPVVFFGKFFPKRKRMAEQAEAPRIILSVTAPSVSMRCEGGLLLRSNTYSKSAAQ